MLKFVRVMIFPFILVCLFVCLCFFLKKLQKYYEPRLLPQAFCRAVCQSTHMLSVCKF